MSGPARSFYDDVLRLAETTRVVDQRGRVLCDVCGLERNEEGTSGICGHQDGCLAHELWLLLWRHSPARATGRVAVVLEPLRTKLYQEVGIDAEAMAASRAPEGLSE